MSIIKQIRRQSTGNNTSSLQAFVSNQYVDINYPEVKPFVFDTPLYGVTGGTTLYYQQDPNSIFTSLSIPFIRFQFTGNTSSLSGDTLIIHEIYKVKYETFKMFNLDFERTSQDKILEEDQITETETTIEDGIEKTKITRRKIESTKNKTTLSQIGFNTRSDLEYQLSKPIHIFTAATSAITSSIYEFKPGSIIKAKNEDGVNISSEKLFNDRSQYFIKTYFRISKKTPDGFIEKYSFGNLISGESKFVSAETKTIEYLYTGVEDHKITASTFSDFTVGGLFFSFFDVPGKPKREEPFVEGELTTFSPNFYFSNVSDGDEYILDINYDLLDTGFTRDIASFKIIKNLSLEGIQKFTSSLRTNSNFAYRIGNVKKIKNLFGVNQRVIAYSDIYTGKTQSSPAALHVFSSSDSPYIEDIPTLSSPPNIFYENPTSNLTLSGVISGSIVTGATVYLTCPDGSAKQMTTSMLGAYSFDSLQSGTYNMQTSYRGYETDVRTFVITGNTELNIKLQILWGNNFDTWGQMANENFYN